MRRRNSAITRVGSSARRLSRARTTTTEMSSSSSATTSLGLRNLVQIFHTTQAQFEDNLIITHNRHQIKTGFLFVRERQDYAYQGNNGALGFLTVNTLTGSGLSDLWMGNLAAGSLRDTGGVVSNPAQLRGNILGAYVQ